MNNLPEAIKLEWPVARAALLESWAIETALLGTGNWEAEKLRKLSEKLRVQRWML